MTLVATLPAVQFVVGLREGVEAALVVGIVATFLHRSGRRDALGWMWAGVALAVGVCPAAAGILEAIDQELPERQQEAFEALVGVLAVGMVTYMIVYMRRHAREMGGDLRGGAARALAAGSAWSFIAMAFLAVMREGVETALFLLATFQSSVGVSPLAGGLAAVAGLLVAAAIGWGIYRGGARLNLARFFRVTAVLLVVIAAGLLASAAHHAAEAGMVTALQGRALDLSAVVVPSSDSVTTGLITGLLGIYPFPTHAEVLVWLLYALPLLTFVLWPAALPDRRLEAAESAESA
jgi:high-affinity iron transporter